MKTDDYKKILKSMLSERRYEHSKNVAHMAKKLAEIWGCDEEKAYIAGLLHDICKEMPSDTQKKYAQKSGYKMDPAEENTDKLLHGIAAAYYIKKEFGIDDKEICDSIRFHTVGRKDMTLLDEIIYVADYVSKDRNLPVTPEVRLLAKKDLKLAVLAELRNSIVTTAYRGGDIPLSTFEAYTQYTNYSKNK